MRIRTSVQVALIVGACTVLAPIYGPSIRARAATPQDDLDKSFKSLATVYSILEDNYADPISSEKAIYQGAIPGMLRTLDPHSNFLDPTEYSDMQRKQRAQYFGIGMLISMDGPKVIAMEPFPGSPAWRADLRRGDVIVAVDGKDVTKKDSARGRRYAARPARQPGARHRDARRRHRTRDGDRDPRRNRNQPGGRFLAQARHRFPQGHQLRSAERVARRGSRPAEAWTNPKSRA